MDLNKLKRIEREADAMGKAIRNEGQVYKQELEDRQRLGLTGEAAIKHYNEWMQRAGMPHLMVPEDPDLNYLDEEEQEQSRGLHR